MIKNINTMHKDRIITIQVPTPRSKEELTMNDVAISVAITSYIESMLDDFDGLNVLNIDDKVKQCVRRFLDQHTKGSAKYMGNDLTLQLSNTLTREIDRFRANTKKNLSKKPMDLGHSLLFMTYELEALHSGLKLLPYKSTLAYVNSVRSLINSLNSYLLKMGFVDKLNIHVKRGDILSILEGYKKECLLIFKDAQDEIERKRTE